MKFSLPSFINKKSFYIPIGFSILVLMVSAVFIGIHIGSLSPSVVLHFDAVQGVQIFGDYVSIWLIWGLGLFITCINGFLGYIFYSREKILSHLFWGVNAPLSLLFFIAINTILSIN